MKQRLVLLAALVFAATLWLAPEAFAGNGNDVARNLGGELRRWGASLYGGFLAIVGLYFLINRKYTELALYLVAAVVVGWLVFSPDQVAAAARAIGDRILP